MARLPQPGADNGTWGDILNDYLSQTHTANGTLKDNTVGTAQLQDNAVTASTIADNAVTAAAIADNSVTTAALADNAVTATSIADGSITETLLDNGVQTKLNQAAPTWSTLSGKPAVIAAGADQAAARTAIGAGTASTKADVGLGNVDNTSDTEKPVSTAQQAALDNKQPLNTDLTAIAGLTSAADTLPYATGSGTWAMASLTGPARNLLGDASVAAMRTTLNAVGKGDLAVNVKSFGAVGDGVADDTVAFAEAISSLTSGSTLYVPHGQYRVSAWPAMPDGTYVCGDGPGSSRILRTGWADDSFIRWAGSLPDTVLASLTAVAGTGTSNLTLDSTANLAAEGLYRIGGTSAFSGTDPLMYKGEIIRVRAINSATSVTIYGVVRDRYTTAETTVIRPFTYKSDVGIQNISIVDTEPGVHKKGLLQFYACRNVSIHNVHLSGGDLHGLQLNSVLNASVSGCHIENGKDDTANGFYGYGIICTRTTENVVVTNCRFERVRHGFTCDSADNTAGIPRNIVVSECVAVDTSSVAFDTHASGAIITFVGCSATKCQSGFQVRAKDTRILSCTVSYCTADGVLFNGDCDGSSLVGSVIRQLRSSSAGRAVRVDGSPDRLMIQGNIFDALQGYGIAVNSNARRMKVLDNLFSHLGGDGTRTIAIWFSNSISDGIGHIIAGNRFIANESATSGETSLPTAQMTYAVDFGTGALTGSYVVDNLAIGLVTGIVNNSGSNTVSNNIVI